MENITNKPEIESLVNKTSFTEEIVQSVPRIDKSRRNFTMLFGLGMIAAPLLGCLSSINIPDDCVDKTAARGVANTILESGLGEENAQAAVDQACK